MNFRTPRKAAGLTLMQAGDKLGVSFATVSAWETGKAVPDSRRLTSIAELYGVSVDELLREPDTDTPGE